jgi:hypothetical protein
MFEKSKPKIIHDGRAGCIQYGGYSYGIEHIDGGHFCIHFPSGNSHQHLQEHLDVLRELAKSKEPKWYVENKSKNYK